MSAANPSQDILDACASSGQDYREQCVDDCAKAYVRSRDLRKLIAVSEAEIENETLPGTEHVIERLEKVADALAACATAGLWHYDTNRHIAILGALKAERSKLAHLQNSQALARLVGGFAA